MSRVITLTYKWASLGTGDCSHGVESVGAAPLARLGTGGGCPAGAPAAPLLLAAPRAPDQGCGGSCSAFGCLFDVLTS